MIFDVIIVDDDPYGIIDIMDTIEPITNLNVVGKFNSVSKALVFLSERRRVNFILSDIEMPGISGIEALDAFTAYCDFLVYVTGHAKYHSQLINSRTVGYLMKPVKIERVIDLVQHLIEIKKHTGVDYALDSAPRFLEVKELNSNTKRTIPVKDILCLTTWGNYVRVHTEEEIFSYYATLTKMESLFCKNGEFLCINQSCIVAKSAIKSIEGEIVHLTNDAEFKVSRSRKAMLSFNLR